MKIRRYNTSHAVFSFLLLIGFSSINAQKNNNRFIIKNSLVLDVFEELDLHEDDILLDYAYDTTIIMSLGFVNPGIIFSTGKRSLHEFEASQLAFSNKKVSVTSYFADSLLHGLIQEYNDKTFHLGLKYFYDYQISESGKTIEFYIGTGMSYFINSIYRNPTSNQIYPWFVRKSNNQRLDFYLRPKVIYNSHKMVIDLSFGLSIYQIYRITNTAEGSIFTVEPRQIKLGDNRFLPGTFSLSLGVGYKLNLSSTTKKH
jgi:hypothetical protein